MKSYNQYIISKNAIRLNLSKFRKINKNCKVCAVVKANGYGVGFENVVSQIDDKVDFYAVASFCEAIMLRKITNKPILILNFVPKQSIYECIKNNISISVCDYEQLKVLCKYIKNSKNKFNDGKLKNKKLNIHFAINTGMNRVGFKSKDLFIKALILLKKYKKFMNIEGIFTHFYKANNNHTTRKQFCIFMQYINILSLHFDIKQIIKHVSNSLAATKYKKYNLDMVRLGIILYGSLENKTFLKKLNLKPAISIKSKLIDFQMIKKGESVGYDASFVASKDMTIGVVPLGYADGIFRNYSKNGFVLCCGKKCKIVGRICMDMFMVDISKTHAKIFDEVVVIGKDKFGNKISVEDLAKKCNTISYEILTNIKKSRFNVKIA